jgi:integrase
VLSPIWTAKPETARRLRQRIEKVLDWSAAHGLRSGDNPASIALLRNVLPPQTEHVKHHAALPYTEVPGFVANLGASTAEPVTKLAFEFLILTACRIGEVVGACWDEVNWQAKTWTVPVSRLKAKKNAKPHVVPLSDRALAILREAKALGGVEYVFPSPAKRWQPLSKGAFDKRIDEAKLTGQVTAHGFRSSFRDWCGEKGVAHDIAEAALAHAIKNKTEAAYHRTKYLEQRSVAMQAWADHVTRHTAERDNVVPIRAAQ